MEKSVLITCPKCGHRINGRLWRCPECGGSGIEHQTEKVEKLPHKSRYRAIAALSMRVKKAV